MSVNDRGIGAAPRGRGNDHCPSSRDHGVVTDPPDVHAPHRTPMRGEARGCTATTPDGMRAANARRTAQAAAEAAEVGHLLDDELCADIAFVCAQIAIAPSRCGPGSSVLTSDIEALLDLCHRRDRLVAERDRRRALSNHARLAEHRARLRRRGAET